VNDVGLLHNMSVPPFSTVQVRRSALPGRRYAIDTKMLTREAVNALRDYGAVAALALMDPEAKDLKTALALHRRDDADAVLAARLSRELESADVPERVGVFIDWDVDTKNTKPVPTPLALALLARRSGPLYLPRRNFTASLIVPARSALVFPDVAEAKRSAGRKGPPYTGHPQKVNDATEQVTRHGI
jgi:hypothetical protein